MSEIRTNKIANTAGVEQYLAKAWVNFNGTGSPSIRAAGNVSSITDNGVGDFTLNFTTPMVDASYSPVFGSPVANDGTKGTVAVAGGYNSPVLLKTAGQLRIQCGNSNGQNFVDFTENYVAIFR